MASFPHFGASIHVLKRKCSVLGCVLRVGNKPFQQESVFVAITANILRFLVVVWMCGL
jgi:hypothetical protein